MILALIIISSVFAIAFFMTCFLLWMAIRKYKMLNNMFEFYDELLNKIISVTTQVDVNATKVLNSSFIDGNPELKKIFTEVKRVRDTYRILTREYNNKNIYGNKVIIEELND